MARPRSQVLQRSHPDLVELKTWATFLRSYAGGSMFPIDARKTAWKLLQGHWDFGGLVFLVDFSNFFPETRNPPGNDGASTLFWGDLRPITQIQEELIRSWTIGRSGPSSSAVHSEETWIPFRPRKKLSNF